MNPHTSKAVRVKYLKVEHQNKVQDCPNFDKSGSIEGMRKQYYGKGALLVRCGNIQRNQET